MNKIGKNIIKKIISQTTGYEIMSVDRDGSYLLYKKRKAEFSGSEQILQLKKLFEALDIDLVIDVGANEGQFCLDLLGGFYSGTILSFEPSPLVYNKLQEVSNNNNNWLVFNYALGDTESCQEFSFYKNAVFNSFLNKNEFCSERFTDESELIKKESVKIRRLDNVLAEVIPNAIKKNIFLKMDTQGYDINVFNGLGSYLEGICLMQSEVSCIPIYEGMIHWTECIAFYENNGFSVVNMYPVTRQNNRIIEYDCLMIKNRKSFEPN